MRKMKTYPIHITNGYLKKNPDIIFVFGDNLLRKGLGGSAKLRYEPNTYGFVTKKKPSKSDKAYYRPKEYSAVYLIEIIKLKAYIRINPNKTFLISKIGGGLANKYNIFDVIKDRILNDLNEFVNVVFLGDWINNA